MVPTALTLPEPLGTTPGTPTHAAARTGEPTPTRGAWRHDRGRELFVELARRPAFDPVGRLRVPGTPGGSGTLIAPDAVLTAAHVVDRSPPDELVFELAGRSHRVVRVDLHPGYASPERVDLAVVRLADPVEAVDPATLHRREDEEGRRAAIVGFGYALPGHTMAGDQTPPGTKHAGFNTLDRVEGARMAVDLDHPDHPRLSATGDPDPDSLEYVPLGGDSGGGVFVEGPGSRWSLAAVVTGGVALDLAHLDRWGWYGVPITLHRVSVQLDWIGSLVPGLAELPDDLPAHDGRDRPSGELPPGEGGVPAP